jgi:hypothetical protein
MRRVFSSNVVSETVLVRDALLRHGIEATVQNAYSGHSAVPEFRPPADIWVTHDMDYDAARLLVKETLSTIDGNREAPPWCCARCNTENPATFELCWNCSKERESADVNDT